MSSMTITEAMAHLPRTDLEDEERAKAAMPHYIFTVGDEKHREGYCTACESWVDCSKAAMQRVPDWAWNDPYLDDSDAEYPFIPFHVMNEYEWDRRNTHRSTHNSTGYCPECGARVIFKCDSRGHARLYDRRFLVRWHKSRLDPTNTLVMTGHEVIIPWRQFEISEPYVPVYTELREVCVITWGKGGDRYVLADKWHDIGGYERRWKHRKECKSGWAPGMSMFNGGIRTVRDNDSFRDAIAGTPWAEALDRLDVWNSCTIADYYDRISLMERIGKCACIEYMCKLGYTQLARAVLDGETHGLINLRGKTARSVLRLTADEWGEVKGKRLIVSIGMLQARRYAHRKKLRLNMELCGWLGRYSFELNAAEDVLRIDPGADVVRAIKYCRKKGIQLSWWRDQLRNMQTLGMDLRDKQFLYPKDFRRSHEMLNERVNVIRQAELLKKRDKTRIEQDAKIEARVKSGELDEYWFSALGLVLRPMLSSTEIIMEGTRQGHCVGGYRDTYANGNDVLCVLRYETDMETPLYTVEFGQDGRLIQCRAYKNKEGPVDKATREAFWRLHSMARKALREQKKKEGENAA